MSNKQVQVLLYTSYLNIIGGIETFVLNFIDLMSPYYSIGLSLVNIPPELEQIITAKIPVFHIREKVSCDTLIMIRVMEDIPPYITYNKSIRMCHACKSDPTWFVKDNCNEIVHVSEASKISFESSGNVIHNPLIKNSNRALLFVSATRIPALDKGKNAERMLQLAKKLNDAKIPFLWLNFSDAPLHNAPKGFINVGTFQDLQPYIARADYLVQLSDHEGFGYSVLEALISGTAVLCTEFETVHELGVEDGKNGYIVPFDLDFDVRKLLDVPRFDYEYHNDIILKAWRKLIGKPKKVVQLKKVEVIEEYHDIELHRLMPVGTIAYMTEERANIVCKAGFCKIVGG